MSAPLLANHDGLTEGAAAEWVKEILRAVGNTRFGSVEIVIHDSKIVQIERREKIRLNGNQDAPSRTA